MESVVRDAPQRGSVRSIDLTLCNLSSERAAGIAEMLSLLPNLKRVVLKSDNETRKPLRKLKGAARLVAGGLARKRGTKRLPYASSDARSTAARKPSLFSSPAM